MSAADQTSRPRRTFSRRLTGGRPRVLAAAIIGALALSGCGLSIPRPSDEPLEPHQRPALRDGEASAFLESYDAKLSEALSGDVGGLDAIQTGPLLERTRAEVLIAEANDRTLSAGSFTDIVAGGPTFDSYPMWFMAFATASPESVPESEGDPENVQAMLVTRESASSEWQAAQSVYIPEELAPTLVGDQTGAVKIADAAQGEAATAVETAASEYLSTGTMPEAPGVPDLSSTRMSELRDYVDGLSDGDTGFSDVDVECAPYEDVPIDGYGLATEAGGVSFGEIRCSLTIEVPEDYSVDLGPDIEAVKTGDGDGSPIRIDVSQPYLLQTGGDAASVYASGWFMLSSSQG